ncbi:unnamed protein product [Effrenium voratum]|nr:unnamed protein product [Effrenium voratum]
MALSQGLRSHVASELQRQLPRLVFAALDHFPLADGLEVKSNRLAVLAVRSLPAAERLDANVAAVVEELARGTHRPPVQLKARQLHLDLVGDEGPVEITVNWHDCLDFARLLQKALPSCVEAIQLNQADVLYATPGWWELQASIAQATQDAMLSGTKPYLKACLGAATSLLHKEKRPKDKGASAAAPIQIVHQLAVRAAKAMGEDKAELVTQFDSLAEQGELSAAPWKLLLQQLGPAADAAPPLPAAVRTSLDQWCHKLRQEDYVIFRESLHDIADDQKALQEWQQRCRNRSQGSCSPSPKLDEESAKAMEQVESLIPDRAELVFLAQSGSFMYDLQVETSDMDFTLVYQALPEALLSPSPPPEEFSRHVNQGFASDKRGVVEFAGRELGSFMALLAKGNPKNVELLFSGKAAHRSWAWEELLEARTCFLTLRCAKQYMGFISERLYRAQDLLKVEEGDGLNPQKASELSKLLYHANHKMLELDRILQGGSPAVALTGKERQAVLQLRLQRPSSLAEARKLVEQAELFRAQLATDLKAAESEQRLPAEVEAEPLLRWLRSVRVRMALGVGPGPSGGAKPLAPLARTRSSEEQEAIKDLIQEISLSEGIQVVVAGYGICSRTLGTSHSKSDHDIKCIFVHPRDAYFGLKSMATTFKRQFAGAAAGDDVEISGWEARHAMQLLAEDNPAVLGLLLSPIIFLGEEWRARLEDMASKLFSRQRLMYHWYNHGRKNFQSYIKSSEEPLRKRYVHVLRPLLTLAWQQRQGSDCFRWPPARLDQLLASVAELGALSQEEAASVVSLIEHVEELPQALPRVGALDALILRLLDRELSFAKPAAAESDAWHKLCVELISTIAP